MGEDLCTPPEMHPSNVHHHVGECDSDDEKGEKMCCLPLHCHQSHRVQVQLEMGVELQVQSVGDQIAPDRML